MPLSDMLHHERDPAPKADEPAIGQPGSVKAAKEAAEFMIAQGVPATGYKQHLRALLTRIDQQEAALKAERNRVEELEQQLRIAHMQVASVEETADEAIARAEQAVAKVRELMEAAAPFLPILERQLASLNPGGAAESAAPFRVAKSRVDKLRAALSAVGDRTGSQPEGRSPETSNASAIPDDLEIVRRAVANSRDEEEKT